MEELKKKGIRVAGIGHRIKSKDNRDKRVELLQQYARKVRCDAMPKNLCSCPGKLSVLERGDGQPCSSRCVLRPSAALPTCLASGAAPVAQKVEHSVFHRGGVGSYPFRSSFSGQATPSNWVAVYPSDRMSLSEYQAALNDQAQISPVARAKLVSP